MNIPGRVRFFDCIVQRPAYWVRIACAKRRVWLGDYLAASLTLRVLLPPKVSGTQSAWGEAGAAGVEG